MMEKIITKIISSQLGEYLEGLDGDNFKLTLRGGKVRLENLKVKNEALNALNLPVSLKYGKVKSLELEIPWLSLGSKPIQIKLSDLYLVIEPTTSFHLHTDPASIEAAKKKALKAKRQQLDLEEAFSTEKYLALLKDQKSEVGIERREEKEAGFFEKMITKLVSNIQVFIDRVHIRYEDFHTCSEPGTGIKHPFIFGLVISSLHVQSTDAAWNPCFL